MIILFNKDRNEYILAQISPLIEKKVEEILNQVLGNKIQEIINNHLQLTKPYQNTQEIPKPDDRDSDEIIDEFPLNNYEKSTEIVLSQEEKDLAQIYTYKVSDLMQYVTEVSETGASISNRRDGQKSAIFKKEKRGNYWIITVEERHYLVPSKKLKINEYNYDTAQTLFECRGYQPGKSENFTLKKPGKISPSRVKDEYQLEEPGILEF